MNFEILENKELLAADIAVDFVNYDESSIIVKFDSDTPDVEFGIANRLKLVDGLHQIKLDGIGVQEALDYYSGLEHVLYAEPNYMLHALNTPNDPMYSQQWGLNNTGQTGGTIDMDIDAPEAWEVTTGSSNTIVAVIDTGVDYNHPDLAANIWNNVAEVGGLPGVDDDGNGYVDDFHGYDFANNDNNPMDDHSHGTHVAGTVAALGNNGIGVTGVAWDAQIMAVKFLDAQGNGTTANAVEAIDYAVDNGAVIANASWGGNEPFSQTMYDAIAAAGEADQVFVAGAGNGNFIGIGQDNDFNPFYPASFDLDNIISVAAIDHVGNRAIFSNYGATSVDIGAPGVNILSTKPGSSYQTLSGTSMATPHVTGVAALLRSEFPTWTYDQVIDQILTSVVPNAALAGITTTGGQLNASNAIPIQHAEISVSANGQEVTDGGSLDMGDVFFGEGPLTQVFEIKNIGLEDLTVDPNITVPTGFSVISGITDTLLSFGESTSFEVAMDVSEITQNSGILSFDNGDADENPFDFTLIGEVTGVSKIDDGDAGYSKVGSWSVSTGTGYQNDHSWSAAGSGADVASWTFNVVPAQYQVSATWVANNPNRATDSPYTIFSGSTALETVDINQELEPSDFAEEGVNWEILGTYSILDTTLKVELSDQANQYVIADGIRIEWIDELPVGPEIEVNEVADGGTFDFGSVILGQPVSKVFTVKNTGTSDLTLNEPIMVPSGFTLLQSFGTTTVGPNESTTFAVQYGASVIGTQQGVLSFTNNDADEGTYDFTLIGTAADITIIDDGDPGFVGPWSISVNGGYNGDHRWNAAGVGNDKASWTFDVTPGEYNVSVTWLPGTNRATDAPYSVYDDTALLNTVDINQELTPTNGWEDLGNYVMTGNTLVVELTDNANEYVIADAVRIERVGGLLEGPEIQVTAGINIVDGVTLFDMGESEIGSGNLSQVFTIENIGTQFLLVDDLINVPTGFTVSSNIPSPFGILLPGEEAMFTIELPDTTEGTFSGEVSFLNTDADEFVFNFDITGTINPEQTVFVMDDEDPGYSQTLGWTQSVNGGLNGDHWYNAAGSGSQFAEWSFDVTPGDYDVAATWLQAVNRATDAPYSVWDDTNLLGTFDINQELAPDDFVDVVGWENLGNFTITSNKLIVRLSDDANQYVIADGIRIEKTSMQMSAIGAAVDALISEPQFDEFDEQVIDMIIEDVVEEQVIDDFIFTEVRNKEPEFMTFVGAQDKLKSFDEIW